MKTNFTQEQLAQPKLAEANKLLQTCTHLGFCTNTCPTYVLDRDENDSPRGRIDLIHEMLCKGGIPHDKTVIHLDRCLSCLSCMTTCAVKVDYAHLIDRARAHIEENYRRPAADRLFRWLIAKTLPHPRVMLVALSLGKLAKPFSFALPKRLRTMLDLLPSGPDLRPHILQPAMLQASENANGDVALLAGCAQQALDAHLNRSTINILRRHGRNVHIIEGMGCCGSLSLHMGRESEAEAFAAKVVRSVTKYVERQPVDVIAINASGCGTTVKDYGHLLATNRELAASAKTVASMAKDISEILKPVDLKVVNRLRYRVAYHDPCSMQHGQKVTKQPRELLRAVGLTVLDVPESHFCCGSAGTYNILQPDIAQALGRRKAGHLKSVSPDLIATGNIGCIMQLRKYSDIPVVHTVELLDWATGGPVPWKVNVSKMTELPEEQSSVEQENEKPQAGATDGIFW